MATPFTEIYDGAIFKVRDSKLASLNLSDQEYVFKRFLKSAIADFAPKCKTFNLKDYNDETDEFTEDLDDEVKEILALGISQHWLDFQMRDKELLRNKMSTKDYQYFSPANLVREMSTMRKQFMTEYKHKIIDYTYDHGDLDMSESQ